MSGNDPRPSLKAALERTFNPFRPSVGGPLPWPRLQGFLEASFEQPDSRGRILSMEGLRGAAIALVFLVHYFAIFEPLLTHNSRLWAVSYFFSVVGNVGVDLFFVLSGYLIYGAAVRRPVLLSAFVRRRIERIFPTFLVVFGVYLVASLAMPSERAMPSGINGLWWVLQNLALLPGVFEIRPLITVAWSLSYEFFFYLAIPTLVAFTGMRGWRRRDRGIFFLALSVIFGALWILSPTLAFRGRMAMFLVGAVIFDLVRSDALEAVVQSTRERFVILGTLAAGGLVYLFQIHHPGVAWLPGANRLAGNYQVVALYITFFLFIIFAIGHNGRLQRFFAFSPIRWFGNMSYSYYLLHGLTLKLVSFVLFRLVPPQPAHWLYLAMLPVSFVATVLTSAVLFLKIERPLGNWVQSLRAPSSPK